MPYREQPADLVRAPKQYPGHDYTGTGEIVVIRAGSEVVGRLTRKGDAVGWLPEPDLSDAADAVRLHVQDILRDGAATGATLTTAWAAILDDAEHDAPTTGALKPKA